MRKILMTLGISLLMVTGVLAQNITLNINDKVVETRVAPIQESGTTLVPLRIIGDNLGAKTHWDGDTQTVTITKQDTEIKLVINKKTVTVNGEEKTLLLAPKLIKGTTLVPFRFIGESLGAEVDWDGGSRTVFLRSKEEPKATYEGEMTLIDGKEVPHGEGTLTFKEGSLKGNFLEGAPVGPVTVELTGMGSAQMTLKDGKPDGKILITLLNGSKGEAEYVGDMKAGLMTVDVLGLGTLEMNIKNSQVVGKAKLTIPGLGTQEIDLADLMR